jgi:hypothetical protein
MGIASLPSSAPKRQCRKSNAATEPPQADAMPPRKIPLLQAQHGALRHALTGDGDKIRDLMRNLQPEQFPDLHARTIAEALFERFEAGAEYDGIRVAEKLTAEGQHDACTALWGILPTPEDVPDFRDCVHTVLNSRRAASRFEILSAEAVMKRPPPTPIIDGFLYADTTAQLLGDAASYKSFQALAIAEAAAGGHDWQGRKTRQTPTVYVSAEGFGGLRQRIKALQIRHQRPCRAQFIIQAVQVHQPNEVDELLQAISQLPAPPGLIVIDTLARCFVGGDENSARDAGLFVAGLDRIRTATGAMVLVVHHNNKGGAGRGSSAFPGAMDTIIEAKKQTTTITLKCLKQKDADEFEPFTLVRRVVELDEVDDMGRPISSLIFEPTDTPATASPDKLTPNEQRCLELLPTIGATSPQWQNLADGQGIVRSTFYHCRDALVLKGKAQKDGEVYSRCE